MQDSPEYKAKKAYFEKVITLYGRNVAVEVLQDTNITIHKLHLSNSNRMDETMQNILSLAKKRGVEVAYHDKTALSRISKNAQQDQGVALDIISATYKSAGEIKEMDKYKLIALDGIENPQNLGMIIRSCAASKIDGIILPKKNSAKISPLVIKASAGTLFKLPIFYCDTLQEVLKEQSNAQIYKLDSHAKESLFEIKQNGKMIFVLGNESSGVSKEVTSLCNASLAIPMSRGVESLNVAVTAALIAFSI